jgi:hypothetical protein
MAQEDDKLESPKSQHWMREYWRPLMAMQYLIVCIFDFVLAPIAWTAFQAYQHQALLTQWNPTTLGSGGTYHLAMGAVLGVAAWTRSMDKQDDMMRGAYMRGQSGAGMYGGGRGYMPPHGTTTQTPVGDPPPRKPLQGME